MPRKGKRSRLSTKSMAAYREQRKRACLGEESKDKKGEKKNARRKLVYHINLKLKRARGQIISKGEMKMVLRLYFHLVLKEEMDPEEAINCVSEALGISRPIVKSARDQFSKDHTIRQKDGSRRGGNHGAKAPPGTTRRLMEKIDVLNREGRPVTAVSLQSWLASEPSPDEMPGRKSIHVSHQTVGNWLHKLGFHRAKGKPGYTLSDERKARIREYVIEVSKAYNLDRDPRSPYKIVYMDESYLRINESSDVSWFELDGDHRAMDPKAIGESIVVMHALTEDGPVIADEWRDGGMREGFPKAEGWLAEEGRRGPWKGKGRSDGPENGRGDGLGERSGGGSGAEGPQEPQGSQEPREPQGTQEPREPQGTQEPREPQGTQEPQGPREPQGTQEPQGSQGSQEPEGPIRNGSEGEVGLHTRGEGDEAQGTSAQGNKRPSGSNPVSNPTGPAVSDEPTAEMIFPAGKNSKGYQNMDCDMFMAWLEKRLWPTFKKMYGNDGKMVLILDNAAHHHGMDESASRRGKRTTFDVPSIEAASVNASIGAASPEVQQTAFKALTEKRPDEILTRAEKWFKQNDAGYMLYIPPYCPYFQPFELFWKDAEHYVAHTYDGSQSTQDVVMWLRRGWYGGNPVGHHAARAPVNCRQLVEHSIYKLNEAVERDEILSGTIEGGLEHIPSSYRVSLQSGMPTVEACDEVELLGVDVMHEESEASEVGE